MYFKMKNSLVTQYGGLNAKPQQIDWDGVAVTPADATNLPSGIARGLYCAVGGNIAGTLACGATFLLTSVPANTIVPIDVLIVASTSTTASGIVALY